MFAGKRCRRAGSRSDRSEHSVYFRLPFYSHHSPLIPFFSGDIFRIRCTVREIDFLDLVAGSEKVEEDRLVHAFFAEFEVISVNRRFGAVFRRYIEPGASGGQNVQDAVDLSEGGSSEQSPRDHRQFPGIPWPPVLSKRSYNYRITSYSISRKIQTIDDVSKIFMCYLLR